LKTLTNPHFAGHRLFQRPSPRKQFPGNCQEPHSYLPHTIRFHLIGLLFGIMGVLTLWTGEAAGEDSAAVQRVFRDPPRQYSTGPLWTWNDRLTEEQIRKTLRDLAAQQVKQVWVHPRPGMMTPYLGREWFSLWKIALDEAERLDMNVWIYDENSYPSGFAGGFVPDAMPESRGRGLSFVEVKQPVQIGNDVLGVYRLGEATSENVTPQARKGEKLPEGRYLVASVRRAANSPWYGGKCYVDLLYPGVTQKFLEITLDAFHREIGDQFGKRVPGSFTDEPQLRPAGGLPWTDDLPAVFQKRWNYSLFDNLPSLTRPVGQWKRVRHNYYQTLLELFVERWAKPYYEYCQKHNLEFTGHYWEHEWPNCIGVPDNMAMYAWLHRPGIDILFNRYAEDVHAQFGNVRSVKELGSVANQLDRRRTLSETFGGSGWDMRLEDIKRQGDWQYALGLNTLNECLSFVTIRGVRKGDYPMSLSYHEPWWEAYHVLARHFTRLSVAMSHGREANPILVIEPTTTAWMYQGEEQLKPLGEQFQKLVTTLAKQQVEFDLGCEDILAGHGTATGGELVVGPCRYGTVVLPPMTENLNTKTAALFETYLAGGGKVIACGTPFERIDGRISSRGSELAQHPGWQRIEPAALSGTLLGLAKDGFAVHPSPDNAGILFHRRRRLDDGDLLLLVNTSIESPSSGVIESSARGVERWCTDTGKVAAYPFATTDRGVTARFELPPCGSLLLFLSKETRKPVPAETAETRTVPPAGPLEIRRLDPNVLVLDYLDVTAGGETHQGLHCRRASKFVFNKHGFPVNPWLHAIQFRDDQIKKTFPPTSGFEATYRFTIQERMPSGLWIVIEQPDLYTITCNGAPVSIEKGAWWLDRAFGRIDIVRASRVGENAVTLKAAPFTLDHELEPAYVLGDFTLKTAEAGWVLRPDGPLALGAWNEQGHPFYAAGATYTQRFDVPQPAGRYCVELPAWYGSVAKVLVNGAKAGYIAHRPWRCDVTEQIRPGVNTVEVVVIGTLKNTLGPHHAGQLRGFAEPFSFERAPEHGPPPGAKYDTIGYGLFQPPTLRQLP
jgi:hypothetical protein